MSHKLWDRIKQINLIKFISSFFQKLKPEKITTVRQHPSNFRPDLRKIGILYDTLADAVNEINSTFSKQVQIDFLY